MSQADALLLGRKTWQGHGAAFDPLPAGDPFGDVLNGIQKYVVSTTLHDTSLWRNSTIISGNVVEEVRKMKAQPGKNIGSAVPVPEGLVSAQSCRSNRSFTGVSVWAL